MANSLTTFALEQEESIWRRKDGRLVRYYPLTNTLHPLLEDDALPVPSSLLIHFRFKGRF